MLRFAAQQIGPPNVCLGSITSFSTPSDHVRSYPNNDQTADPPLWSRWVNKDISSSHRECPLFRS
jgi:hypothetical protein